MSLSPNQLKPNRRSVFFAFLLSLVGCENGASSAGGSQAPKTSSEGSGALKGQVLATGDSITNGLKIRVRYPDIVARMTGMTVQNIAVDGSPASRIASDAVHVISKKGKPKYLMALMGTNNANAGIDGGVNGAVGAIKYLVRYCKEAGIPLVLGTLPPITTSPEANRKSAAISDAIRRLDYPRIAKVRAVVSEDDLLDDLHPDEASHHDIARAFAAHLH